MGFLRVYTRDYEQTDAPRQQGANSFILWANQRFGMLVTGGGISTPGGASTKISNHNVVEPVFRRLLFNHVVVVL
ncbi:hypothetical protein LJC35_01155 [Parabacteroides sp. OttesenSCG-928-N08]|nr:hypothetical protein [Parabacteroides sp. OttesenSCG-928-N08]